MDVSVYMTGLTMGLGLIVAIGAQNAFVLRQGIRREHVFAVCLTCALSDAVLITVGVTGFRTIVAVMPALDLAMRFGGAAFLLWYAIRSLLSALRSSHGLVAGGREPESLGRTLAICLALTWLNPHVYLDTVVLLGTISTQFPEARLAFAVGATTASFLFFFALGFGARWLQPLFAKPASWRVLETLIGALMLVIATRLVGGS
jgi:L-lysine exporter family protein LysE/ArgO